MTSDNNGRKRGDETCAHKDYASSVSQFLTRNRSDTNSPYRNNITLSRANVLPLIYPAIEHWLGPQVMTALSRCYAEHYPSVHWDINQYGSRFHELITAQRQGSKADAYPWHVLGQVAQLEYALCQLYYEAALPPEQLTEQSLEDATHSKTLHLPDVSPHTLSMIKEHHALMDSPILIDPSQDNDTTVVHVYRKDFRFAVFLETPAPRQDA